MQEQRSREAKKAEATLVPTQVAQLSMAAGDLGFGGRRRGKVGELVKPNVHSREDKTRPPAAARVLVASGTQVGLGRPNNAGPFFIFYLFFHSVSLSPPLSMQAVPAVTLEIVNRPSMQTAQEKPINNNSLHPCLSITNLTSKLLRLF